MDVWNGLIPEHRTSSVFDTNLWETIQIHAPELLVHRSGMLVLLIHLE